MRSVRPGHYRAAIHVGGADFSGKPLPLRRSLRARCIVRAKCIRTERPFVGPSGSLASTWPTQQINRRYHLLGQLCVASWRRSRLEEVAPMCRGNVRARRRWYCRVGGRDPATLEFLQPERCRIAHGMRISRRFYSTAFGAEVAT